MNTEIIYNGGMYDIKVGGIWVDTARTQHDAEVLLGTIQEAQTSWAMGGCDDPNMLRCATCGGDGDCPDCDAVLDIEGLHIIAPWAAPDQPLLAQCAALCDALLGGPIIGGGILDELRRVRAALAEQGW